jgi:rod shape determining protein RodA
LIITLLFGKEIRYTKGWLPIGPVNFQFSEISKITTILFLAKYIDYHFREFNSFKDFILPFIIILAPIFLILLQPDMGSTFVYLPVFFVMIFLADANLKYLGYFFIIGTLSIIMPLMITYYELTGSITDSIFLKIFKDQSLYFSILLIIFLLAAFFKTIFIFYPRYNTLNKISNIVFILLIGLLFSNTVNHKLKLYQKRRLLVFIDPKIDPYGSGYNIIQSKIAMGA